MKSKIYSSIVILFLLTAACSEEKMPPQNESFDDRQEVYHMNTDKLAAVDVNNLISGMQKKSLELIDSLFNADSASVENKMSELLFELEVCINRLSEIDNLPEVEPFILAVTNLLSFYKTEVETNFKTFVPLIYKRGRSDDEQALLDDYDSNFVKKEAELFGHIINAQEVFATANNIILSN